MVLVNIFALEAFALGLAAAESGRREGIIIRRKRPRYKKYEKGKHVPE